MMRQRGLTQPTCDALSIAVPARFPEAREEFAHTQSLFVSSVLEDGKTFRCEARKEVCGRGKQLFLLLIAFLSGPG